MSTVPEIGRSRVSKRHTRERLDHAIDIKNALRQSVSSSATKYIWKASFIARVGATTEKNKWKKTKEN